MMKESLSRCLVFVLHKTCRRQLGQLPIALPSSYRLLQDGHPVRYHSKAGGEIVFTVQTAQLDPVCKVILKDRLTNTFTNLSKNSYKVAGAANTSGTGRFYLHTGDIVNVVEDQGLPGKVTAYTKGNKEIGVIGEVGSNAIATLYDGLGKVVRQKKWVPET